jgi:murein endopeptidase
MRSLVVAIGLLCFTTTVEAKPKKKSSTSKVEKTDKRGKKVLKKKKGKRVAHAGKQRREPRVVIRGQSVGAPWSGRLRNGTELGEGEGYFVRRPWRAFGTKRTVSAIERVIAAVREQIPELHVLAIGDLSAEHGGFISEHSSHQSGRDADLGLYYYTRPRAYPWSFVVATEENLDLEATFALIVELAKTGDVHMMFLDFDVQGLIYEWALANGEDEDRLARLFQFPHGRGTSVGMVRHEPNHADHLHVRFHCPKSDSACR